MFHLIYNFLSILLLFPVCLYHLYRSLSRNRQPGFAERFGFIPRSGLKKLAGRPVIWLHAVSVGETVAARPLLKALRVNYPRHAIVISNTTETGRGVASGFPEIDLGIYFPFDFLPAVWIALNRIKPELVVIMETEIWPNFCCETKRRGIPLILANGRISDRSFERYRHLGWFFSHSLQQFTWLCMQSATDSDRITRMGAPADRVKTLGNLKYDIPLRQVDNEEKRRLRKLYAVPEDMIVLIAGSTHSGEEPVIIDTYRELLETVGNIFLILVPRHPERAEEVAQVLRNSSLHYRLRTAAPTEMIPASGGVLLVDTIGEMMNLYAMSDIAFVGGSLVPTGGHNLLEPASIGIPSLFGPYMANFREIEALVLEYGAGIRVETPSMLTESCRALIMSRELRNVLGLNGLKMLRDNGGATERHMETITGYPGNAFKTI